MSGTKDTIEITNLGPGDAYDVNVSTEVDQGLQPDHAGFPLRWLPAGKSVNIPRYGSLGGRRTTYFDLTISARTADGLEFSQVEFVSTP